MGSGKVEGGGGGWRRNGDCRGNILLTAGRGAPTAISAADVLDLNEMCASTGDQISPERKGGHPW